MHSTSTSSAVFQRQLGSYQARPFKRVTASSLQGMWRSLALESCLRGHRGSVNCISFNESGSLLISGSDDTTVRVWDVGQDFNPTLKGCFKTKHKANICDAHFMYYSGDSRIISCGQDGAVLITDIADDTTQCVTHHPKTVNKVGLYEASPDSIISASEDGTVRHVDLRVAKQHQVVVDLNRLSLEMPSRIGLISAAGVNKVHGKDFVIYSMASPQYRNWLLAVGASDDVCRVYDRRMISQSASIGSGKMVASFSPRGPDHQFHSDAISGVCLSEDGSSLLVSYIGDHTYSFGVNNDSCLRLQSSTSTMDRAGHPKRQQSLEGVSAATITAATTAMAELAESYAVMPPGSVPALRNLPSHSSFLIGVPDPAKLQQGQPQQLQQPLHQSQQHQPRLQPAEGEEVYKQILRPGSVDSLGFLPSDQRKRSHSCQGDHDSKQDSRAWQSDFSMRQGDDSCEADGEAGDGKGICMIGGADHDREGGSGGAARAGNSMDDTYEEDGSCSGSEEVTEQQGVEGFLQREARMEEGLDGAGQGMGDMESDHSDSEEGDGEAQDEQEESSGSADLAVDDNDELNVDVGSHNADWFDGVSAAPLKARAWGRKFAAGKDPRCKRYDRGTSGNCNTDNDEEAGLVTSSKKVGKHINSVSHLMRQLGTNLMQGSGDTASLQHYRSSGFHSAPVATYSLDQASSSQSVARSSSLGLQQRLTFQGVKHESRFSTCFQGQNNTLSLKGVTFVGADESLVAAGSDGGYMMVWDRHTGGLVTSLKADESWVTYVTSHPHLPMLASCGADRSVKLWTPSRQRARSRAGSEKVHKLLAKNEVERFCLSTRQRSVDDCRFTFSQSQVLLLERIRATSKPS